MWRQKEGTLPRVPPGVLMVRWLLATWLTAARGAELLSLPAGYRFGCEMPWDVHGREEERRAAQPPRGLPAFSCAFLFSLTKPSMLYFGTRLLAIDEGGLAVIVFRDQRL